MNREAIPCSCNPMGVPRVSGDEPQKKTRHEPGLLCSPRERG